MQSDPSVELCKLILSSGGATLPFTFGKGGFASNCKFKTFLLHCWRRSLRVCDQVDPQAGPGQTSAPHSSRVVEL